MAVDDALSLDVLVRDALSLAVDSVAVDSVAVDSVAVDSVAVDSLCVAEVLDRVEAEVTKLDTVELSPPEVADSDSDADSVSEVSATNVPNVVGSAKLTTVAVNCALKLVISIFSFPLAVPLTLVPISDAEPHPY